MVMYLFCLKLGNVRKKAFLQEYISGADFYYSIFLNIEKF